jgi:very-short-patch-repair endonuclease
MTPINQSITTSGVIRLQRLSPGKLDQARVLRKKMTVAESLLWERLHRKGGMNIKFRRQQIVYGFIVDFYCEKAKLVIEVDGPVHDTDEQKAVDEHRRKVFLARGLKEMRFTNKDVFSDIETVLGKIREGVLG